MTTMQAGLAPSAPHDKAALALDAMRDRLRAKAAALDAPRLENTPKRACEGMRRRIDSRNLTRAANACEVLLGALLSDTLPPEYRAVRSAAMICRLTARQHDCRSYYVVVESDRHTDESEFARSFRDWLAGRLSDGHHSDAEARLARDRIDHAKALIRFESIPGFFPTPKCVADQLFDRLGGVEGLRVLEPSAGIGSLAIEARDRGASVRCIERIDRLAAIARMEGLECEVADFLDVEPERVFDAVVMNPPFEGTLAVEHFRRALLWLRPGGKIAAVMPASLMFSHGKSPSGEVRAFITDLGGLLEALPQGSFASSFRPTGVSCCLVVCTVPE